MFSVLIYFVMFSWIESRFFFVRLGLEVPGWVLRVIGGWRSVWTVIVGDCILGRPGFLLIFFEFDLVSESAFAARSSTGGFCFLEAEADLACLERVLFLRSIVFMVSGLAWEPVQPFLTGFSWSCFCLEVILKLWILGCSRCSLASSWVLVPLTRKK